MKTDGRQGRLDGVTSILETKRRVAGVPGGLRLDGVRRERNLPAGSHRTPRGEGSCPSLGSRDRPAVYDEQANPGYSSTVHLGPRMDQGPDGGLKTPSVEFSL